MSATHTEALGRQFFAAQDRMRGGPEAALCAEDYRATINANPPMNLAGHQAFSTAFYAAFPDTAHTIDEIVAQDDRVAVRFTLRGTHQGSFFGIPPTQRPIAVPAVVIMHVRDGRVTDLQGVFDQLGLMQQIGALPGPAGGA
jgi:predicted ester cyclase